ncbi:F0F1 ATP synthase subunit epsilon [Trinickia dinghuensis]|uniref:F0F1 ATP synthase subunit epsilon n=1 Tax=Trinickia dinghuensis TaxID=2291023 RepID=A0A3D8K1Q0_9BURK|nr:F0F1 ATP synthase subunit epsilon [Trinickia dinghuensis]RDU99387.1 F0F1 ATP synthase subunit epsilon [Trinickia dinghuensis]
MRHVCLTLCIATPTNVPVDALPILSLRAEDESGSFGVRQGHADLVALLTPTVVRWTAADGTPGFCAVDGGVLTVSLGTRIDIACRDAVRGDDLARLEETVYATRAARLDATRRAHVDAVRLHARTVRQIVRYLSSSPPSEAGYDPAAPEVTR